jgi:hypothetical protein
MARQETLTHKAIGGSARVLACDDRYSVVGARRWRVLRRRLLGFEQTSKPAARTLIHRCPALALHHMIGCASVCQPMNLSVCVYPVRVDTTRALARLGRNRVRPIPSTTTQLRFRVRALFRERSARNGTMGLGILTRRGASDMRRRSSAVVNTAKCCEASGLEPALLAFQRSQKSGGIFASFDHFH